MITQEEADSATRFVKTRAALADMRGQNALAELCRVEACNMQMRVNMKKAHRPNPGPYSATNPCHCKDCGKLKGWWKDDVECIPDN